jgi:hypothetical protein
MMRFILILMLNEYLEAIYNDPILNQPVNDGIRFFGFDRK